MSTQTYSFPKRIPTEQPLDGARLLYFTISQYTAEWICKPHTHNSTEIFFVTGGLGSFEANNKVFPVATNDVIIIDRNVLHTERSQEHNPLTYFVLGIQGAGIDTGSDGYEIIHMFEGREQVWACLSLLEYEGKHGQKNYELLCHQLAKIILLQLQRRSSLFTATNSEHPHVRLECDRIKTYIDNHFKENLSLDSLAKIVNISKHYLSHTFKASVGVSPIHYMLNRRIEESCFLLREYDYNLSEIALYVGFSSLSYFSQRFRITMGCTPSEYRARFRQ